MGLWRLRLTILGTLALIIGFTSLIVVVVLNYLGITDIIVVGSLVVFFNVIQWLIAPFIIDLVYKVREPARGELEWLKEAVERISRRSGIKPPRLLIAEIPIPNAFAYGSPIAGSRIAVTRGLLEALPPSEVEAVVGHEIGHLKHRDVAIMMLVSVLPALVFTIGRWLMIAGLYGSRRSERNEGALFAIGAGLIVASWLLNLMILGLSRLREYYADAHSAMVVEDGARKLQLALTRITLATSSMRFRGVDPSSYSHFRALFITDPIRAVSDAEEIRSLSGDKWLMVEVEKLKSKELSIWESIAELFSTHPNIVKRLRALDELAKTSRI